MGQAQLGLVDERVLDRLGRGGHLRAPEAHGGVEPRRRRVELLPQGTRARRVVQLVLEVGLHHEVAHAHDARQGREGAGSTVPSCTGSSTAPSRLAEPGDP